MNSKSFKTPDLHAKRYRPKVLGLLNAETVEEYRNKKGKAHIDDALFKAIVTNFNQKVWEMVIENRDGVELPDGLGFLFIGTCPPAKSKTNIDYANSTKYGVTVSNKNWETDNKLAKIMYSNYHLKYQFAHRELWGFTAVRQFKRAVAATYPTNWTKYVQLGDRNRVNDLFNKSVRRAKAKEISEIQIETYNEFEFD
jgi:hypothetical protein